MRERLEAILSEFGRKAEEGRRAGLLLPLLRRVRAEFGGVPEELIGPIAEFVGLPESQVFSVLTFYPWFGGEKGVVVCTGLSCRLKGASRILEEVRRLAREDRKSVV